MTEEQQRFSTTRAVNLITECGDFILVVVGIAALFLLAGYFDVSEVWSEWAAAHEEWELDEVPMGLSLASIGMAVFAFRRWRESRSMAQRLNRSNEELEERVADRTATVEAQAAELELALKTQIEFNELQREFISMASHEFRTPLTVIDGNAQRILRTKDRISMDDVVERASTIRGATTHMIGLIDSTLSAEQLEAGKIKLNLKAVDLTDLLKGVQDRQQEISPSHRITSDIQGLPEEIRGDPRLLEQVFANLLSNAVKFSPHQPRVEVTGRRDGEDVVLAVRDHGVGVPANEVPRLFQRYFRASTTTGISGTGIGLHVVKKLLEMHGGSIAVESVEGEGTTFTARLPIAGPRISGMDSVDRDAPPARPAVTAAA